MRSWDATARTAGTVTEGRRRRVHKGAVLVGDCAKRPLYVGKLDSDDAKRSTIVRCDRCGAAHRTMVDGWVTIVRAAAPPGCVGLEPVTDWIGPTGYVEDYFGSCGVVGAAIGLLDGGQVEAQGGAQEGPARVAFGIVGEGGVHLDGV